MQLVFEHIQEIGPGTNPAAVHSPDEVAQVFYINNGVLTTLIGDTEGGYWDDRVFSDPYEISDDESAQYLNVRYSPGNAVYLMWENDGQYRWVPYLLRIIITNLIANGSIDLKQISGVSMELENPYHELIREQFTILTPGNIVTLNFQMGNSAHMPMGEFYLDRTNFGVLNERIGLEGRNVIGKKLRDQSLDEHNYFPPDLIHNQVEAILEDAGIVRYDIEETNIVKGISFPPQKKAYEAVLDFLEDVHDWKIEEVILGGRRKTRVVVANQSSALFPQPGTYTMQRGRDCFSREILRDDNDVYSRVCVWSAEGTTAYSERLGRGEVEFANVSVGITKRTVGYKFLVDVDGVDPFEDTGNSITKITFHHKKSQTSKDITFHIWRDRADDPLEGPELLASVTKFCAAGAVTTIDLPAPIELLQDEYYVVAVDIDEFGTDQTSTVPVFDDILSFAGTFSSDEDELATYPALPWPDSPGDWFPLINFVIQKEIAPAMTTVFRSIPTVENWNLPEKKTYYTEVPVGTTGAQMQDIADRLAERMSRSGIVEKFRGPFRPQLQNGDTAKIVDPTGTTLIGVVTDVQHKFGKGGFETNFTVDSGGVLGQEQIKGFVNKIIRDENIGVGELVF